MFRRSDFKKLEYYEGGGKKNTKIFKVEHIPTKKIYALKEVEAKNLEKLNEYKEEAVQLSKAQNHPNILQFYGYYFYETPHETYKIGLICEFLNYSQNFEKIYKYREAKNNFWKEDDLLKIYYSLIDALAFLQSIGICHRDIKPANLFLTKDNQVKVIDFGESKDHSTEEGIAMATIRGTPQYLSPILWEAHVMTPGTKQIEHDVYKSDVFSCGLVLYQLSALKDVTGFNQKTMYNNGEKLIRDSLVHLGKRYSNKITDILRLMLAFDEDRRPNFVELGKIVFGESYIPNTEKEPIASTNLSVSTKNAKIIEKSEDRATMFKNYVDKFKLKFNMNKITYWCEYGGNMIGKFYVNKEDNKWKLIGKYKAEFPSHFVIVYVDEDVGHFLIGGTDSNNTFQYRDGQITKKSSMNMERSFASCLHINGSIVAIGGYEFNDKNQLATIEVYDIDTDKWTIGLFEDLKVPRSQASALLLNDTNIYVFGGYNKSLGTLNSIERISILDKTTQLLDTKIPIPLRRFGSLKISDSRVLLMGGITRVCKETDTVYCYDASKNTFTTIPNLPRAGIIDHEILMDELGQVHLFFENNYGTSPPIHTIYNYFDFK